jgi:glucosylglycerate hydrolase
VTEGHTPQSQASSDPQLLRDRAEAVLRDNDLGTMITAAPRLYPHMWSWDAAFVAMGLSRLSVPRAVQEMRTLVEAQWDSGMIPHIVFSDAPGYFPDVHRWGTIGASPDGVLSSGICQPPVHAIALRFIVDAARDVGGEVQNDAERFLRETFDRLVSWHRWLAAARDPSGVGLLEIHHGWESGMDNSPRFDGPYSRVSPGYLEPYERTDLKYADASERPSQQEYDRYLWLVQQMAEVGFDDDRVREVVDFRVHDVFMSAIMSIACDVLGGLAEELGRDDDAKEQRDLAARFADGVASTIDPSTGLARDYDLRADEWIATETIAGFAPLLCSGDSAVRRRQWQILRGERWLAHPDLRFALIPSTSPASPDYRPRTYWRGPVWPVMNWFVGWACATHGEKEDYEALREESLAQLSDLAFGEYYEPSTGEPLGSQNQSWTAAVALLWLNGR